MRVWNFTDDCGNTSAPFTQTITVEDNTAPGVTTVAGSLDATLECSDATGIAAAIAAAPTATDNCDATPTIHLLSDDTTPGSCQQEYVRVRVWNFTDDCGNTSASFTQTITVEDNTAPGVTTVAGSLDATLECSDATGIAAAIAAAPSATDNCDATPTIHLLSDDTTPGSCQQEYVRVRVWNFTDDCGNTSGSFTQTITVEDNTAPMITCLGNVIKNCQDDLSPSATGIATSTDNCDSNPVITSTDVSTQNSDPEVCGHYSYTITRTWKATDACGNTSTCNQVITVQDVTAPSITCPPDITVLYPNSTLPTATGNATSVDACDPSPSISYIDNLPGLYCLPEHRIIRTWIATDACGNSTTCQQSILNDLSGTICGSVHTDLGQTTVRGGNQVNG